MMERAATHYEAALYGRAPGRMPLPPLDFPAVRLLLPRYSPVQQVETCAIIGGVPSYLELWDDRRPVLENVRRLMLGPGGLFLVDPPYLLGDVLHRPRDYAAILLAVASGRCTPHAIGTATAARPCS